MQTDDVHSDKDLVLTWSNHKQDLKVTHNDVVLLNTVTGFAHKSLSERQVKWIMEHYEKVRNVYVF